MLSVCSAWVSQLIKSCSELWKSVACVSASSSLTCETDTEEKNFSGLEKKGEKKTKRLVATTLAKDGR